MKGVLGMRWIIDGVPCSLAFSIFDVRYEGLWIDSLFCNDDESSEMLMQVTLREARVYEMPHLCFQQRCHSWPNSQSIYFTEKLQENGNHSERQRPTSRAPR